jgi:hypothetical protein
MFEVIYLKKLAFDAQVPRRIEKIFLKISHHKDISRFLQFYKKF